MPETLKWSKAPPTEAGLYLAANPAVGLLHPYKVSVIRAGPGGEKLGLEAGLWVTLHGRLKPVERVPLIWFGPIPLDWMNGDG